jgi:Rieske Fe-S protein
MDAISRLSRRGFIKTATLLTAISTLGTKRWTETVVAQLLPKGGVLRLNLGDFPALQSDFGSVRIGTNPVVPAPSPGAPACRKPLNTIPDLYPVIINRAPGNKFFALNSACTHEACAVARFGGGTTGFMQCPGHGTRFRIDGTVIAGSGPANFPLTSYEVEFDHANTLRIKLPDIFFELSTVGVVPEGARKFALNFLASTNVTYEVRHRATLASPSVAVPFSTTPEGPATNSIAGVDDYVTVFVERQTPAGFYSVAMKVSEV